MDIFTKTYAKRNKKGLGNDVYLLLVRVTLDEGLANYSLQARSGPT